MTSVYSFVSVQIDAVKDDENGIIRLSVHFSPSGVDATSIK